MQHQYSEDENNKKVNKKDDLDNPYSDDGIDLEDLFDD